MLLQQKDAFNGRNRFYFSVFIYTRGNRRTVGRVVSGGKQAISSSQNLLFLFSYRSLSFFAACAHRQVIYSKVG
jgi:hypothetical protein